MLRGAWGGDNIRSFQAGWDTMWLRWTSGITGAVATIDPTKRYGYAKVGGAVAPAVRTGVGTFTLNLADQWNDFLNLDYNIIQAAYSAAGACQVQVTGFNLAAKTVSILVTNAAGAAVDPTTGDKVIIGLSMQAFQNT
jgi:hypothetical protein